MGKAAAGAIRHGAPIGGVVGVALSAVAVAIGIAVAFVFAFAFPAPAAAAAAEALHPSLGAVSLLEDDFAPLDAPAHVKVVDKGGKLSLEGAASVMEASQALAAWHVEHDELDPAMKVVEAGLKQAAKDEALLAFGASIALRLGDASKALGFVEQGLKRGAENGPLLYLKGRALESLGRKEEAVAALSQAARLSPGDLHYQMALGGLYFELGKLDEAVQAFRSASDIDRTSLVAACNLGAALLTSGHDADALAVYQGIAGLANPQAEGRKAPALARALANWGAIQLRAEAWDRAASAYDNALHLDPKVPGGDYNRAYLHYREGELDAAYEGYRRALAADPSLPLAYLHLGEIDASRGKAAEAVDWLKKGAGSFDPALAHRALVLTGDSYRKLGDLESAAGAYRHALETSPDDLPTITALAAISRLSGKLAEARSLLENAQKRAPGNTSLLLERAALAQAEGKFEEEKNLYREILAKEGEGDATFVVQLNLALLLLREGGTEEARKRLEPLLLRLTSAEAGSGGDSLVSTDAARVLATAYGMLVAKEGALDEATRRFADVAKQVDGFPPALEALAVMAALAGDLEGARVKMTELVGKLDGKDSGAMAHGNLGLVLWLSGRDADARDHLRAAVEKFPAWLSIRIALGEVELRTGRFASAIDEATEARKLCDRATASSSELGQGLPPNWLQVTIGGARGKSDAPVPLCERVSRDLASAYVGAAVTTLGRVPAEPAARTQIRQWLDRALSLPLAPVDRSRALFVRGTLSLLDGTDDAARQDLTTALSGNLDSALRSLAENNLGVALHNLGQAPEAERHFDAARKNAEGLAAATLNLGITLDERDENRKALALYEEYVASPAGAPRRTEVRSWIEDLRRIYR
jgi:tetratricopeptide (TPR) repeat protein